jgi:hypothetical protein
VYVKLFSKIIRSSIWAETSDTRIVWVTMLLLANRDGFVESSPSGLAREANVTVPACREALKVLEAPDIESSTQEYGGRRIDAMEGGWQILNYGKYRELRDAETVRLQTKERVRKHREKKRDVTLGNAPKRQAEAEAEAVKTLPGSVNPEVAAVLAHYLALHPGRRPFDGDGKPKAPAQRAVKKALGWGFTVDQLKAVLSANAADAWHRTHKKHELEYVFRTEDKVRGWLERATTEDEPVYADVTFVN